MGCTRRRLVCEQHLLVVPEAVAVGIAIGGTHQPREAYRIKLRLAFVRPSNPGVMAWGYLQCCGGRNDVLTAVRGGTKDGVEAVEELVVVVHAIVIGIPQARIGTNVAAGVNVVLGQVHIAVRNHLWRNRYTDIHHRTAYVSGHHNVEFGAV